MSQKSGYLGIPFVIWILGNILGFGALGLSLIVLPSLMSIPGTINPLLILTIPISLAQWIVLRRIVPTSIFWILTIPLGLFIAVLIFQGIPESLWTIIDDESIPVLVGLYLVMGLTIGVPQWILLRRQFSGSSRWLLGSSIGVAGGFGLVLTTGLIHQSEIIATILVVLFYALATGLTLLWLLATRTQSLTIPGSAI